jgi:hypothetical protein
MTLSEQIDATLADLRAHYPSTEWTREGERTIQGHAAIIGRLVFRAHYIRENGSADGTWTVKMAGIDTTMVFAPGQDPTALRREMTDRATKQRATLKRLDLELDWWVSGPRG